MTEIRELQGLTGNGIRKLAQGRRTDTDAWIEVYLGNVTDIYYNNIHGTSIVDGHLLLQNKTAAEIVIRCLDAPVENERVQVYKAVAGAGETKIGEPVDITDDPLVHTDSGGNWQNDPIEWYGLGIRKCKFTGLEDRWYEATVETNLVADHGNGACKIAKIKFRPKRQNSVRIVNVGCCGEWYRLAGIGYGGDNSYDPQNGYQWPEYFPAIVLNKIIKQGVDYVVSGDDFNYASATLANRGCWWALPRDSNTSTSPVGTFIQNDFVESMIANNINVGDQCTDIEYQMGWDNMCTALDPFFVRLGHHAVIVPSDIGDHGIRRSNGTNFGVFTNVENYRNSHAVDYGFGLGENTSAARPANDALTCWLHDGDGLSGSLPVDNDPYAQSGVLKTNIINDMVNFESYRTFCVNILDFMWYQRCEHNIASQTPTTMVIPKYINNMDNWTDPTLAAPNGLNAPNEYYYYPRWKHMDFGTHCRVYFVDNSFFNYSGPVMYEGGKQTVRDGLIFRTGAPDSIRDSMEEVMSMSQINDLRLHMEASDHIFSSYAVVIGDVTYPVDVSEGGSDIGEFTNTRQNDGYSQAAKAEWFEFKDIIENLDCPVFLLTSDDHINACMQYVPNVVEFHGSTGPQSQRTCAIPPEHEYIHQEINFAGFDYFSSSQNQTSAVVKTASPNNTLDIVSSRFYVKEGQLLFEDGDKSPERLSSGDLVDGVSFSTLKVN